MEDNTNGKNGKVIITLSSGYKVEVIGMPQTLIEKIRAGTKHPPVPTYAAPTVTDPDARLPHEHRMVAIRRWNSKTEQNETVDELKSTLETAEDRAAWDAYKEACAVEDRRIAALITNAMIFRGIKVFGEPEPGWDDIQKMLGVTIPDNQSERWMHWVSTEVIRTEQDIRQIFIECLKSTGMTEEQLNELTASFRNQVEGPQAVGAVEDNKEQLGR